MDNYILQTLITQGRIVTSAEIDPNNSYLQVGVYQKGNRKSGSANDAYPAFAIPLSEIGGGNVTPQFQYEIGQYVAAQGGVIANRWLSNSAGGSPTLGTVQNYLVVDTQDLPAVLWATSNANILNVESTWNGLTNTGNIYDAGIEGGFGTPAATSCYNSSNNGKTDWYLPAIDELNKVWDNRWEIAQGLQAASGTQLSFNSYWGSTELDGDFAWYFDFFTGFAGTSDKSNNNFVRAIRKFTI